MPCLPQNPSFTAAIAAILKSDPVHADGINSIFSQFLGNDLSLKARADGADVRLDGLDVAISDVINASAIGITKVVTLQSELSSVRFSAELFLDGWRMVDSVAVAVTDSRGGDESIDVADTRSLKVGQSYVITDAQGSVILTIAAILDDHRIRATVDMPRTFAPGAVLARTNWACSDQYAEAPAGGVYFSRPLNLGWDVAVPRTLILCSDTNTAPEVAYKDSNHGEWTVVPWAWRRAGDGHFEYAVPATGEFVLRITNNAPMRVDWMFATSAPSQLGGTAAPPLAPRLTLPAEGVVGISETPTLTTAGFTSATGLTMAAAEWQVKRATDEGWDNPLWQSVSTTTSTRLPAGVLAVNLSVVWRCRMQDSQGQWSEWSESGFTCAPEFKYIQTPAVESPLDGATDINAEAAMTLTGSAFAVIGGTDSFAAQQWQVSDVFGAVWTSAEITTSGNVSLPADTLQPGWKTYAVQVRHKGTVLGWSEWSNPVTITTKGFTLESATPTKLGGVMLATTAETMAGANDSKAVVPTGLAAALAKFKVDNPVKDTGVFVGEIRLLPFRAADLPAGWHVCNGGGFATSSAQGKALAALPANFKTDWKVTVSGSTIYKPNLLTGGAVSGQGPFFRPSTSVPGTVVADAIRNITGKTQSTAFNETTTAINDGALAILSSPKLIGAVGAVGLGSGPLSFDSSRVVPTAAENRPFHIAMTPAIWLGC